jgi:hypothetical protein
VFNAGLLWCGLVTTSGKQSKNRKSACQQVQPTQCLACGEWEQVSCVLTGNGSLTYREENLIVIRNYQNIRLYAYITLLEVKVSCFVVLKCV